MAVGTARKLFIRKYALTVEDPCLLGNMYKYHDVVGRNVLLGVWVQTYDHGNERILVANAQR